MPSDFAHDLVLDKNGDLQVVDGFSGLLGQLTDTVVEQYTKQMNEVETMIAHTMLRSAPTSIGSPLLGEPSYGSSFSSSSEQMAKLELYRDTLRNDLRRYMNLNLSPKFFYKMPQTYKQIMRRKPDW